MDTQRVDICYRPLRIAWAIRADDADAFRRAVRLSHALWGGRFNPIIQVNREDEARRLIESFRVDVIWPVGDSDEVKAFPGKLPHLISPFFSDSLFSRDDRGHHAHVLDVHNALVHLRDKPEWKAIKDAGARAYSWQVDDPLSDVFLMLFGDYPSTAETGIDYRTLFTQAAEATDFPLHAESPIPADVTEHPNVAYLSQHGLKRHYSVRGGWDGPGFFVGQARNLDDLVCYWNLRAADVALWFVDPSHTERFAEIVPAWETVCRQSVAVRRHDQDRRLALWSRRENMEEARRPFAGMELMFSAVSENLWNGQNLRPPMMYFDRVSTLGVVLDGKGPPRVTFPLSEKPFSSDIWFHPQYLVASLSFMGLYGDQQHTIAPPYIPELNAFYARNMHLEHDKLRVEPSMIGLVIDVTDTDSWVHALSVADLVERIFDMAGYRAKLSSGGLILRQLISRLGGVQGARVFKVPGVRRLIRTHGPTAAFTKKSAIELIASKDPENPNAKFESHENLYIEARRIGTKLQPDAVFAHLVEKGLFRIGVKLTCPNCNLDSWIALDTLKQRVICELCGQEHDATKQLVNTEWHYRRSGILGVERNSQGAIPVALTLQQLDANLSGLSYKAMYSPSLSLARESQQHHECEIDFVWILPREYPRKTAIIIGECKDQGQIKLADFERDIENLRLVADALPSSRFRTFVLLAKLSTFTPEEIERAKTLNTSSELRTILLTARELEPYRIYERTKAEFNIDDRGRSPEEFAKTTAKIYFDPKDRPH